jgi:hypothetical protein
VIPLDSFPQQPEPPLEIGTPFLETGPMSPPFELPTGAVWQPSLMAFGTVRTAVQTFDNGVNARISEWTNQASLYANLQLTGTERVLVEFRPLDNYQHYFGQEFEPHRKFHDREYGDLREAFFEGDFHQLFPRLDPYDRYGLDYGFSIGRQPLLLQDGLLLDDTIDSVGVIRNHILSPNFPPLRVTGYFGWDQIHRANNQRDNSARLVAVDASADDYTLGIIDLDAVYIPAGTKTGSGIYGGIGLTNRVQLLERIFNVTARINGSYAINRNTPQTSSGALLFGEISRTPGLSGNFVYLDSYLGVGDFSSAARRPDRGGPLGRVGILYDAPGLGNYSSALSEDPANSGGLSVGYQMFFDNARRQLTLETGGRLSTHVEDQTAIALGGRLQQAIGRHLILQLDSFIAGQERRSVGYGGRGEAIFKF